jgi:hypothetical protein
MYIDSFTSDAATPSGAFYVLDLVTEAAERVRCAFHSTSLIAHAHTLLLAWAWLRRGPCAPLCFCVCVLCVRKVPATYAEALGMAIRYQEPMLVSRDALLATSSDFLARMLLAFTQDSAAGAPAAETAALGALAARWGAAASLADTSAQARAHAYTHPHNLAGC